LLWFRKGKEFCERALALHRQQHGKDKKNIEVAPPRGKVFVDAHASDLKFFQISGIFPTCFGCFLPANATNKKSLNYGNSYQLFLCSIQSLET